MVLSCAVRYCNGIVFTANCTGLPAIGEPLTVHPLKLQQSPVEVVNVISVPFGKSWNVWLAAGSYRCGGTAADRYRAAPVRGNGKVHRLRVTVTDRFNSVM